MHLGCIQKLFSSLVNGQFKEIAAANRVNSISFAHNCDPDRVDNGPESGGNYHNLSDANRQLSSVAC